MTPQESTTITGIQVKQDFGYGLSTKSRAQPLHDGHPGPGQSKASKALSLAGYFVSGCMAINASQFLGAPLYLINEDWYNAWMAFTKQSWGLLTMTMTQWWAPTIVRVSGDSTVRGQLLKTTDASLLCNFPERIILIANHQIYTDWLYLWWIGYTAGMHGRIYVVLKESLKKIPVIGWGMQFAQFIFLKRKWEQDKPRMAAHLQKFNNPKDPMWLMMFPEGTNLADSTREASKQWADKSGIQDMQHTLLPRSTGLHFILQELRSTVDYVYDCTIAYEGVPRGEYAQDIFTVGASYFGGRPPKSVNMYWRRFRVSHIPLDDPKQFDFWLRQRWSEKDKFIEDYLRTGRFPADNGSSKDSKGQPIKGAGHIEAEIRPKYWYEFLQVFAPFGLFALVLYMFYGALPTEVLEKIKSIDQKAVLKQIGAYQRGEIKVPDQKKMKAVAVKALEDQQKIGGSKIRNAALAHGLVTLNGVPQNRIPAQGSGDGKQTRPAKVEKPSKKTNTSTNAIPKHKTKGATFDGVCLQDLPSKGFKNQARVFHASSKNKSTRTPKSIPKLKGVTLNGAPLKDFPAKGLEGVAGISEVQPGVANPKVATKIQNVASRMSTNTLTPQKPQSNREINKTAQARIKGKEPPKRLVTTKPVSIDKQAANSRQDVGTKPRWTTGTETLASTNLTAEARGRGSWKQPVHQTKTSLGASAALQENPEDQNAENAEVRKARKKLELRKARHEPKRKTRRAVEETAVSSRET